MKTIKRNYSLNFPIKLNYKSNDLVYSYRGGRSTSNIKLINVNKNKYFEENKSFVLCDKNYKNEAYISNSKTINNKNKKNDIKSNLINNYNNNIPINTYIDNYLNNKQISYISNNNSNIYLNNNEFNDNYKYYLKNRNNISNDNSKNNISNTIADINLYNNNINNYIFPYIRTKNNDRNLFNKRQIYKKPKNERTLSSFSFVLTDYNSIGKENLNLNAKSNLNINIEANNTNFINSNLNRSKKYILIPQRYTDIPGINMYKENNINNYCNNNKYNNINNQSFMHERRTNIDYSNLNLYSPKVEKDIIIKSNISHMKKSRPRIRSDIIKSDINDTISYFSENHYKTTNDNNIDNSYIYVRKNSSKKNNLNKKNINNNKNNKNKNKIKVNLRPNTIIDNAFYVQKNVILIQKNYRMHLACLKKCILKAIKKIIEGTNKLYYLFYKNIAKKFFYILNNAYIKSIDINMKTSEIIPKYNNKKNFIENSKNNITKPKLFFLINNPERYKNLSNNRNKINKYINSPKLRIEAKPKCINDNLKKIKKDIELIRSLKKQIITKIDMFKK